MHDEVSPIKWMMNKSTVNKVNYDEAKQTTQCNDGEARQVSQCNDGEDKQFKHYSIDEQVERIIAELELGA